MWIWDLFTHNSQHKCLHVIFSIPALQLEHLQWQHQFRNRAWFMLLRCSSRWSRLSHPADFSERVCYPPWHPDMDCGGIRKIPLGGCRSGRGSLLHLHCWLRDCGKQHVHVHCWADCGDSCWSNQYRVCLFWFCCRWRCNHSFSIFGIWLISDKQSTHAYPGGWRWGWSRNQCSSKWSQWCDHNLRNSV